MVRAIIPRLRSIPNIPHGIPCYEMQVKWALEPNKLPCTSSVCQWHLGFTLDNHVYVYSTLQHKYHGPPSCLIAEYFQHSNIPAISKTFLSNRSHEALHCTCHRSRLGVENRHVSILSYRHSYKSLVPLLLAQILTSQSPGPSPHATITTGASSQPAHQTSSRSQRNSAINTPERKLSPCLPLAPL